MTPEAIKNLRQLMFESKSNSNTTTINKEHLTLHLAEIFHQKPPSEYLIDALYNRFKPLKIGREGQGVEQGEEMDIIDFLMACNLLSRVT